MKPPEGYLKAKLGQVCCLIKSLYRLKQAGRQWNKELTGMENQFVALFVYVDDLLITKATEVDLIIVKSYLHQAFTIKDLGYTKYFLGVELLRSDVALLINQHKYILDILNDAGMLETKPMEYPILKSHKLDAVIGDLLHELECYISIVGRLLYLNLTQPDVSYTIQ
ncbi:uncharacterized mitochondrial protein AtMg00810-like [Hevea brasiliensis]|uniref:uncharacterized mitochondrial protein AtMg00810-like n=1 Tax=Hevea brasiliensis TaxID=3981 RepID=UPI0025F3AC51|nr:uncharacterized mitochondrial protein AtMg00810-like [Hevea brasiliensis]